MFLIVFGVHCFSRSSKTFSGGTPFCINLLAKIISFLFNGSAGPATSDYNFNRTSYSKSKNWGNCNTMITIFGIKFTFKCRIPNFRITFFPFQSFYSFNIHFCIQSDSLFRVRTNITTFKLIYIFIIIISIPYSIWTFIRNSNSFMI